MLANRLAQTSRAEAMDDTDRLLPFEERAVEELIRLVERVVDTLTDEVQFSGDGNGVVGPSNGHFLRFALSALRSTDRRQIPHVHRHLPSVDVHDRFAAVDRDHRAAHLELTVLDLVAGVHLALL